jgi:hypothetical protein
VDSFQRRNQRPSSTISPQFDDASQQPGPGCCTLQRPRHPAARSERLTPEQLDEPALLRVIVSPAKPC